MLVFLFTFKINLMILNEKLDDFLEKKIHTELSNIQKWANRKLQIRLLVKNISKFNLHDLFHLRKYGSGNLFSKGNNEKKLLETKF